MQPAQHIVVVDDEENLRASVADYLRLQGFRASVADGGAALRAVLASEPVDLVLLDLRMPVEDGLSILRGLVEARRPPVIMVTAMGDAIDRVIGLELGADDYVVKPFEMRELLARIRSVLRRTAPEPAVIPSAQTAGRLIRVGCRLLDLDARRLYADSGEEVPLTTMEFDLLKVFVTHANRALTRDQLLELAHNDSWEPFDRSIDIRVARLRRKVEIDPSRPEAIRTVRGTGYMFLPAAR